jgi:spore maturation protein A
MLNYIWLSLIIIGIVVAAATDWHDLSTDRYRNDEQDFVTIRLLDSTVSTPDYNTPYPCSILYHSPLEKKSDAISSETSQKGELTFSGPGNGLVRIFVGPGAPAQWRERLSVQPGADAIYARVRWIGRERGIIPLAPLEFDKLKFVKLNAVTNDGILKSAKTAVELAIGLIGVMALWLGVMKIAEQAGLVAKLAKLLRPVTRLIFPDVPADHPAMGAMIMNISANMLGLSNAATPLGIKAMEELNKLNHKAGTATDAMCTFLVINTSNVQLIPATVIAIRASAGSSNPAEVVGPVLVATALTLVIGITLAKLLARLPVFRKQLAP